MLKNTRLAVMVLIVSCQATIAQIPTPGLDIFCTGRGCPCVGDCNRDDIVTVDELLTMVNAALDDTPVDACATGDEDGDRRFSVDEVLFALQYAQQGCPATPGYCSKCSCEFTTGSGFVVVRGAVPSCTEPCDWLCREYNSCDRLVSTSCLISDWEPMYEVE